MTSRAREAAELTLIRDSGAGLSRAHAAGLESGDGACGPLGDGEGGEGDGERRPLTKPSAACVACGASRQLAAVVAEAGASAIASDVRRSAAEPRALAALLGEHAHECDGGGAAGSAADGGGAYDGMADGVVADGDIADGDLGRALEHRLTEQVRCAALLLLWELKPALSDGARSLAAAVCGALLGLVAPPDALSDKWRDRGARRHLCAWQALCVLARHLDHLEQEHLERASCVWAALRVEQRSDVRTYIEYFASRLLAAGRQDAWTSLGDSLADASLPCDAASSLCLVAGSAIPQLPREQRGDALRRVLPLLACWSMARFHCTRLVAQLTLQRLAQTFADDDLCSLPLPYIRTICSFLEAHQPHAAAAAAAAVLLSPVDGSAEVDGEHIDGKQMLRLLLRGHSEGHADTAGRGDGDVSPPGALERVAAAGQLLALHSRCATEEVEKITCHSRVCA